MYCVEFEGRGWNGWCLGSEWKSGEGGICRVGGM